MNNESLKKSSRGRPKVKNSTPETYSSPNTPDKIIS